MVKKIALFFVLSTLTCGLFAQQSDSISEQHLITFIENAPIFKGDLKDFVDKNIVYPDSACSDLFKDTVIVEFKQDSLYSLRI